MQLIEKPKTYYKNKSAINITVVSAVDRQIVAPCPAPHGSPWVTPWARMDCHDRPVGHSYAPRGPLSDPKLLGWCAHLKKPLLLLSPFRNCMSHELLFLKTSHRYFPQGQGCLVAGENLCQAIAGANLSAITHSHSFSFLCYIAFLVETPAMCKGLSIPW